MTSSGQGHPASNASNPRRAIRGFTAAGVGLGILALALAGYIAVSEITRYQHQAQIDRFISELRELADVFENYRQKKGAWPPATNPDIRVPLGMENVLASTTWKSGPPVGGAYDWQPPLRLTGDEKDAAVRPAFIAVTAFSPGSPLALTLEDLRYIDQKLDDGNLTTGRFRTGFNGWPIYLFESASSPKT